MNGPTPSHNTSKRRTTYGAGIVEGVVGIGIIVASTVGAVLLLANAGLAVYFQDKLHLVANQVAQLVVSSPNNIEQQNLEKVVNGLLKLTGLPNASKIDVNIGVPIGDRTGAVVTIAGNFPLLGNGTILPASLTVQETAVAIVSRLQEQELLPEEPSAFIEIPVDKAAPVFLPAFSANDGFYLRHPELLSRVTSLFSDRVFGPFKPPHFQAIDGSINGCIVQGKFPPSPEERLKAELDAVKDLLQQKGNQAF